MAHSHIALPYRLFFLYIEPVFALSGAAMCLLTPQSFLERTTPSSVLGGADVTPMVRLLLSQVGALYAMHATIISLALRASTDLRVWRAVLLGICLADVGHLGSLYLADATRLLSVWAWSADDWANYGILSFGLMMRVLFLLGVGVGVGR